MDRKIYFDSFDNAIAVISTAGRSGYYAYGFVEDCKRERDEYPVYKRTEGKIVAIIHRKGAGGYLEFKGNSESHFNDISEVFKRGIVPRDCHTNSLPIKKRKNSRAPRKKK